MNNLVGDWYLLFYGTSTDGRGNPKYYGRTRSKAEAERFFIKEEKSPYSISKVMIATNKEYRQMENSDIGEKNE